MGNIGLGELFWRDSSLGGDGGVARVDNFVGVLFSLWRKENAKGLVRSDVERVKYYWFPVSAPALPLRALVLWSRLRFQQCADLDCSIFGCSVRHSAWGLSVTRFRCSSQSKTTSTIRNLVAMYRAMRLRFGYRFESCDANGLRNIKNQNLGKQRPFFPHYSVRLAFATKAISLEKFYPEHCSKHPTKIPWKYQKDIPKTLILSVFWWVFSQGGVLYFRLPLHDLSFLRIDLGTTSQLPLFVGLLCVALTA